MKILHLTPDLMLLSCYHAGQLKKFLGHILDRIPDLISGRIFK